MLVALPAHVHYYFYDYNKFCMKLNVDEITFYYVSIWIYTNFPGHPDLPQAPVSNIVTRTGRRHRCVSSVGHRFPSPI